MVLHSIVDARTASHYSTRDRSAQVFSLLRIFTIGVWGAAGGRATRSAPNPQPPAMLQAQSIVSIPAGPSSVIIPANKQSLFVNSAIDHEVLSMPLRRILQIED